MRLGLRLCLYGVGFALWLLAGGAWAEEIEPKELQLIKIGLPSDTNRLQLAFQEIGSFWQDQREIPVFGTKTLLLGADPEPKTPLLWWLRLDSDSLVIRPLQGRGMVLQIRNGENDEILAEDYADELYRVDEQGVKIFRGNAQVEIFATEPSPSEGQNFLGKGSFQLIKSPSPLKVFITIPREKGRGYKGFKNSTPD